MWYITDDLFNIFRTPYSDFRRWIAIFYPYFLKNNWITGKYWCSIVELLVINIDRDICKSLWNTHFCYAYEVCCTNWSLRNKIVDLVNLQDSVYRIEFISQRLYQAWEVFRIVLMNFLNQTCLWSTYYCSSDLRWNKVN